MGGGGAFFSPSINPYNDNEYYVSCDMGNLFHTLDYGLNYESINFISIRGGQNSKVQFTNEPQILYCINYSEGSPQPIKSTDGGKSWKSLPGTPDLYDETYTIRVDFSHPERVLISYYNSLYFSSDGGNKFKLIAQATNNGTGIIFSGVFFDQDNIFIGTNEGLFVSIDGGTSFQNKNIAGIPLGESIFSFAGAKQGSITRFFCLTGSSSSMWVGMPGSDYWNFLKGIYSLDYGSVNWVSKMNGITKGSDHLVFIDMATNDINTVYAAGSSSSNEPNIMKTTDGGSSWSHTFNTGNNQNIGTGWSGNYGDRGWSYGESPFGISVAPFNSKKIIFGDFGFVHKSSNGGDTWQQAYLSASDQNSMGSRTPIGKNYHSIGLENTSCWQVVWMDSLNMFACFSDIKGIRSTDAGKTWSFNYSGHNANTMHRIIKSNSNNYLYAGTSNIHDIYQSTRLQDNLLDANDSYGKIIYSTDKGIIWKDIHSFGHPVFWIEIDPNNNNRLYASVVHHTLGGVYITNDLQNGPSSTWTKLPNPPRTEGHPASIVVLNDGNMVCTYSGRRTTGFTASSGVFVYNPNTNNWTDVSDPNMFYWTKDIVIDPNDILQNTWYVGVFSGWGGAPNGKGGLYKTINRGKNWTKVNNLDRVTSCSFNPNNKNEVYLTTEYNGLWFCNNINTSSPTFNLVSSYPFKQPERVFFNPFIKEEIWVTSFGNGLKFGSVNITNSIINNQNEIPSEIQLFQNYPNPFNPLTNISFSLTEKENVRLTVYSILGSEINNLFSGSLDAGRYDFFWDGSNRQGTRLSSGVYIYKLQSRKNTIAKKMNLLK